MPEGLAERFPCYAAKQRSSYLGLPVVDPADGRVIGHVAVWHRGRLQSADILAHPVFRILASRIGAELRRKRADDTMLLVAAVDNDEYDLAGTPCELTIRERRTTFIGERLKTIFACCAGDQVCYANTVALQTRIDASTHQRHVSVTANFSAASGLSSWILARSCRSRRPPSP